MQGHNMDRYDPELRIEVWDMDKQRGVRRKGDFMGEARLTGPKMLRPGRKKRERMLVRFMLFRIKWLSLRVN